MESKKKNTPLRREEEDRSGVLLTHLGGNSQSPSNKGPQKEGFYPQDPGQRRAHGGLTGR